MKRKDWKLVGIILGLIGLGNVIILVNIIVLVDFLIGFPLLILILMSGQW